MSTRFNYHKTTKKWELFESDLSEFFAKKRSIQEYSKGQKHTALDIGQMVSS